MLDSFGQKIPSTCPRYRVTRLCAFCWAVSDVAPAYSVSDRYVILGNSLAIVSVNPFSRCSVLSEPTAYRSRMILPLAPQELAQPLGRQHPAVVVVGRHVADGLRRLQARVDDHHRDALGDRRPPPACTRARASSGARTMPSTPAAIAFWTSWICCDRRPPSAAPAR